MILISKIFCTGFGVGKIPFFPGSLASLSILPIIWVIKKNQSTEFFLIVIAIYLIISYFLIKVCISNQSNKDPSYIVVDEHLGQAVTLLFCDEVFIEYLFAFLLFRFFDILKPYPINYIDNNFKNGFGVVFDDIVAGIFTTIVLYIFIIIYDKF